VLTEGKLMEHNAGGHTSSKDLLLGWVCANLSVLLGVVTLALFQLIPPGDGKMPTEPLPQAINLNINVHADPEKVTIQPPRIHTIDKNVASPDSKTKIQDEVDEIGTYEENLLKGTSKIQPSKAAMEDSDLQRTTETLPSP